MDDRDDWGPWDPEKRENRDDLRVPLPVLRQPSKPKPSTVFQRLSTGRYGRNSEQRSPIPTRAICLMSGFKNSVGPMRSRLRGKPLKSIRLGTACEVDKSHNQPDLRVSMRIKSLVKERHLVPRRCLQSADLRLPSPPVLCFSYSPVSSLPINYHLPVVDLPPSHPSESTTSRLRHSSIC